MTAHYFSQGTVSQMNQYLYKYFINYNSVYNDDVIVHAEPLEKESLVDKVSFLINSLLWIIIRHFLFL